jgi:hypothetical protein
MPLRLVYHVCDRNSEEQGTRECYHKGDRYHSAAMPLVFAALTRGELDIALLTVCVWFRPKHTSDRFDNRLGCIRDRRRRAGRNVGVFVGMREKLNIIVLGDCSVLRMSLTIIPVHKNLYDKIRLQLTSTRKKCVD